MATAGRMLSVMAEALNVSDSKVTVYYKALRAKGLISTTGRGRSAQDVKPLDASRLLIAMLSASSIKEAADMSELVGGYQLHETDELVLFEEYLARIITNSEHTYRLSIAITPNELNARVKSENLDLYFSHPEDDICERYHPDDWATMTLKERLILRGTLHGIRETRAIDGYVLSNIASCLFEAPAVMPNGLAV